MNKRKRYQQFLMVAVLIFTLICTACGNSVSVDGTEDTVALEEKEPVGIVYAIYGAEYRTFEELIQYSNMAVVGEFIETIENEKSIEYRFKVKECLYGSVGGDEIYLYDTYRDTSVSQINYTYRTNPDFYRKNTEYILVMEKTESIMYDHDRYQVAADLYLCESENVFTLYSQPIVWPEGTDLKDYICSVYSQYVPLDTGSTEAIVYENDIAEMAGESQYIGVVNILKLEWEGVVHNGDTYRCTVDSLIKGDEVNTYGDGTFLLVIRKGTVEVGKSYLVGFNAADEGSYIHSQATLASVHAPSDDLMEEISGYLDK